MVFHQWVSTEASIFSHAKRFFKKILVTNGINILWIFPEDVRRLAYECAVKFGIKIPASWTTNKMAGKEWLTMFLKRNPELSIQKPEPTSLGRATSFNVQNVKVFFDKLAEVMDIYRFSASQI